MNKSKAISISHINVRQSISFLILKFIVIDISTIIITLIFFFPIPSQFLILRISLYLLFMIAKLGLLLWVVIQ